MLLGFKLYKICVPCSVYHVLYTPKRVLAMNCAPHRDPRTGSCDQYSVWCFVGHLLPGLVLELLTIGRGACGRDPCGDTDTKKTTASHTEKLATFLVTLPNRRCLQRLTLTDCAFSRE